MGRINELLVSGYRSIDEEVVVTFPVLGESFPGSHQPEDNEFFGRTKNGGEICIQASVSGVTHTNYRGRDDVLNFKWQWPCDGDRPFSMRLASGGENAFVSNETRAQCTCIYVGADRRLDYQLSY